MTKVHSRQELTPALNLASEFAMKILVERAVNAREIEVSVLGNHDPQASIPGEIVPHREFYDYAAKYLEEGTKLLIPADLKPAQVYVSLPRRAEIANQAWETDHNIIFVSIHFNQSAVGYVDGIETYYADEKIPLATDWRWIGFFQNSDDETLDRGTALAADIQGA